MAGLEDELEHSPPPQRNSRKRTWIDDPADQLSESDRPVEDEPSRPPKRRRSTTKLSEDEDTCGQRRWTRQRRSKATSPYPIRSPRPSKFAEGSMNDKPSKRPPSLYTADEDAMEEYMAGPATSRPSVTRPARDTSNVYDAGIDQDKPSTMYRFGRAIANAFNPGVWTGRWKSKEPPVDPQKNILEAYAELKKSGFTRAHATTVTPMAGEIRSNQHDAAPRSSQTASFRDSAIDMEESRPSVESKENQPNDVMPAPSVPLVQRSVTPLPRASSRRSSLNLHTPSLSTLKRVGSHLQLPSAKRHSTQDSVRSGTDSINSGVDGQLRKQPSKKDMLKQQRLYKRVSNLESQLEAARRELDGLEASKEIAHEGSKLPSIRPKPFMPGALPSLPSERLLKDHLPQTGINDGQTNILPTSESLPGVTLQSRYSAEHQRGSSNLPIIFPNLPSARQRTSSQKSDRVPNPTAPVNKADADVPATTEPVAKRPRGHPRNEDRVPTSQPRPVIPGPIPLTTPSRERTPTTAPPVPPLPTPFHPSQVDKVKIMLMRPPTDYQLPFGRSASDAPNLSKTYPLITPSQIDALLGKPAPNKQNVNLTSTTHFHNLATPPPPRSPSPAAATFKPSICKSSLRSRSHKVPNNSPVSVRKTAQDVFAEITQAAKEEEGDIVTPLIQSLEGKELPPYPRDPGMTVLSDGKEKGVDVGEEAGAEMGLGSEVGVEKGEGGREKPLPGIQREVFEWDEDVF